MSAISLALLIFNCTNTLFLYPSIHPCFYSFIHCFSFSLFYIIPFYIFIFTAFFSFYDLSVRLSSLFSLPSLLTLISFLFISFFFFIFSSFLLVSTPRLLLPFCFLFSFKSLTFFSFHPLP